MHHDLPRDADTKALRSLHAAHLQAVPFENLDIHLGVPLSLDLADLTDKIVRRRRGGFCYELNGLFAWLLTSLGYQVTMLGARVWGGSTFGPPMDHLVLRVRCVDDPTPWFADVGFGAHSLYPLRYELRRPQDDPGGVFQVVPGEEGDVDVLRNGVVQYRIEPHQRGLLDFQAMCWYQQSSPQSPFTRSLVCTIQTLDGRLTLSDRRLVRTAGAHRSESVVEDDTQLRHAYLTTFGIGLDELPIPPADRGD